MVIWFLDSLCQLNNTFHNHARNNREIHSGDEEEKGVIYYYGIKFAGRHARESTLSALHAFASSGQ